MTTLLWTIVGKHQILEIIEKHGKKRINASSLRIIIKILNNLIGLENIAIDDGITQLIAIEVLAHPYLILHNLGCHSPILCWKRQQHLVQFARQTVQVGTYRICNNLCRLRVDRRLVGLQIAFDERWQLALAEFLAFKQHAMLASILPFL